MGGRHGLVTVTSANLKHRLNKFHKISQNLTQIMTSSQETDAARKKRSETVTTHVTRAFRDMGKLRHMMM